MRRSPQGARNDAKDPRGPVTPVRHCDGCRAGTRCCRRLRAAPRGGQALGPRPCVVAAAAVGAGSEPIPGCAAGRIRNVSLTAKTSRAAFRHQVAPRRRQPILHGRRLLPCRLPRRFTAVLAAGLAHARQSSGQGCAERRPARAFDATPTVTPTPPQRHSIAPVVPAAQAETARRSRSDTKRLRQHPAPSRAAHRSAAFEQVGWPAAGARDPPVARTATCRA